MRLMTVGVVRGLLGLVTLSGVVFASSAHADPTPPPTATSAAVPAANPPLPAGATSAPDVVRLKDGSMLRGTIGELKAGEFVVLVMITGEVRKIPLADVAYAGAAVPTDAPTRTSAQPSANSEAEPTESHDRERSLITVEGPAAKVRFESPVAMVTLYHRAATAGFSGGAQNVKGFDEICTTTCQVSLPAGTYSFAVSKPKHAPIDAPQVTLPAGKSVVHVEFAQRSTASYVGIAIGSALLVSGLAYAAFGGSTPDNTCEGIGNCHEGSPSMTHLYVGAGIALFGGIVLGASARVPDGVTLRVSPGWGAAKSPEAIALRNSEAAQTARVDRSGLLGLRVMATF